MELMRVSELAARSGVPATTLRYYEERGLLPARRSRAGYRLYGQRSLDRLVFISTAKRLGLGLDEIGDLMVVWSNHPCWRVKASLGSRLDERLEQTRVRMAELEDFQTLLGNARSRLRELPDGDQPCDPGCAFLAATAPGVDAATTSSTRAHDRTAHRAEITDSSRHRVAQWRTLLATGKAVGRAYGWSWRLPLEHAGQVAEMAAAEQQASGFLNLRIDFSPHAVHLHVSAQPHDLLKAGSTAEQIVEVLGVLQPTPHQTQEDAAHVVE